MRSIFFFFLEKEESKRKPTLENKNKTFSGIKYCNFNKSEKLKFC